MVWPVTALLPTHTCCGQVRKLHTRPSPDAAVLGVASGVHENLVSALVLCIDCVERHLRPTPSVVTTTITSDVDRHS